MSPPAPELLRCLLCPTQIIAMCPTCQSTANLPIKAERGIRLSTGQHLKVAFCVACLDAVTPAQFPVILRAVKARFELLWQGQETPPAQRAQMRADWETWTAIGWADEIPGLEHVLAAQMPPEVLPPQEA